MHRSEVPPPQLAPHAEWFDFLARIHASLDLDDVASAIVNELRRLLACDRVGLALVSRGRAKLIAASGQESFDRRSNVARAWEDFTEAVAALGEPLWYDETPVSRAPQIETALQHLLDVSPARFCAVVPLRASKPAAGEAEARPGERLPDHVGWLIVERFEQASGIATASPAMLRERLSMIAPHVGAALDNSGQYERLPLRRVGEQLRNVARGRFASRWWKWGAIPLALVAASLLIPAELKIEARGKLQPARRRNVFAPVDGIVTSVRVRHGTDVGAEETLLTLHSPELDFELTRVSGEIQTSEKRLASVQATRLRGSPAGTSDTSERFRLTAEEEEMKQQLIGLREQHAELLRQRQALVVTSPLAGQVLTWDVEQSLAARPVRKGQLLLSIGDVAGPWELELLVPDDRIGYVHEAQREQKTPLEVEFVSAAAPQTTYTAQVRETARRSEAPVDGEATVRVTADIGAMPRDELRPGAAVVAKLRCGETSLARSWLLDLIHVVRTQLLF
ncbi:MAG: HlyD family efflux transporter periplasmic adaptor subunit [Planctomycetia bacterium]|nr:HlyD family efflux transporter periplasmic adaptor subunit [Planctomycetia bacterium]